MPRKYTANIVAGLVLAGATLMMSAPASATAFCNIKPTSDGFVALRAGPGSATKLIGRMTAKDEVLIGPGEKGGWIEVTWWRGDDRLSKGYDRKSGHGWVNRKLIGEECG